MGFQVILKDLVIAVIVLNKLPRICKAPSTACFYNFHGNKEMKDSMKSVFKFQIETDISFKSRPNTIGANHVIN